MRYSVVEQVYRDMLDDLDGGELFANYSNAEILQSVDETAYRCGLVDYSDAFPCVECGREFSVDDYEDSDGVCPDCSTEDEDEQDEPTESEV
jgi:hypothetical protein